MEKLNLNDRYEVRLVSEITDLDKKTLTLLYQPLIGHVSLALYLTLVELGKTSKENDILFLSKQLDVTLNDLLIAFSRLEALGLIRRFVEKEKLFNVYYLDVYAPKDPNGFFNDIIFVSLLKKYVGNDHFEELVNAFKLEQSAKKGKEVSASITDVFHPSLDDVNFKEQMVNFSTGRKTSNLEISFNQNKFLTILNEKYGISKEMLNKTQVNKISRLATLHHFDEKRMAEQVSHVLDPRAKAGNNIDFDALKENLEAENIFNEYLVPKKKSEPQILKGETNNIVLMNIMETDEPQRFLCRLLNIAELPRANKRLIDNLALKYNFNNAVINALIFWVLKNNEGSLVTNYVESFAIPLKANNFTKAVDVLDYLDSQLLKINDSKKRDVTLETSLDKENVEQEEKKEEKSGEVNVDLEELRRKLLE